MPAEESAPPEEEDFDFAVQGGPPGPGGRLYTIYAPGSNINNGSVHGDQRAENIGTSAGLGGRRVRAHEGPISAQEILAAQAGFAEPDWFSTALAELDTSLLFLVGDPGTGRRTAALNLLRRHAGGSMDLRALDGDVDLASWQPTRAQARGYLVYGLWPRLSLSPPVMANLRAQLDKAQARMVIVLPDDPSLVRSLSRDLHVTPVRCRPPDPRAVFDARLKSAAPHAAERDRLLGRLEPGTLDDLLTPELVPSQVAELVDAVSRADGDGPDVAGLRDRLSFLADDEAPDLIKQLHDDPDGLAFLLAACVFEGLDHRIIREEAERLLELADGRLDSVLTEKGDSDGGQGTARHREGPRPNPTFVFRRSLSELLRMVRARRAPKAVWSTYRYSYTVEPVLFTRHRQREAVLRHVWQEYGSLSGLLTDWMGSVSGNEHELAVPVGQIMGMAAGWGGGRRALSHISKLACSDRLTSRTIAAYALGMAAEDPVLASEVKYCLNMWSHRSGSELRSTVVLVCGTNFGASRPDLAMQLLRNSYRGRDGDEYAVGLAVRRALHTLFDADRQPTVFRHLVDWSDRGGPDAELALWAFPQLLWKSSWLQEQLVTVTDFTEKIIELVRRTLNDDELFDDARIALLDWCRSAHWYEQQTAAVETLLSALAQDMKHGELRLFVEIDRNDDADLAGRDIARHALQAWRQGASRQYSDASPNGGNDDH